MMLRTDKLPSAWLSSGIASVIPEPLHVEERARLAVRMRNDDLIIGTIRVGVWTLERPESIEHYLCEVGVDGVTVTPRAIAPTSTLVTNSS